MTLSGKIFVKRLEHPKRKRNPDYKFKQNCVKNMNNIKPCQKNFYQSHFT